MRESQLYNYKNYSFDLAAHAKKILIVLYYLEKRSKKRTDEAIKNMLSIQDLDFYVTLNMAESEGWIERTNSSMSITPEGFEYLEKENFSSRLKEHVFNYNLFSYRRRKNDKRIAYIDVLRELFVKAINDLKEPEMLLNIMEEVKSGRSYFMLSREVKNTVIRGRKGSSDYARSSASLKEDLDGEILGWVYELVENLRVYGLIKLSSQKISPETYIFPEQQFKEILEERVELNFDTDEKEEAKPLKVLPNNEILIEIGANFNDLKTIADFADLVSADTVCTFSITKASLSKFMNQSGNLDTVMSFLKEKSSVEIPNTVERLISDMDRKKDEISITKCQAVLQVSDRTIIDEIMRIKAISELIEKRITPEILVVKEGVSLYKFVTEVRKKGYVVPISIEKEKNRRRNTWNSWRS